MLTTDKTRQTAVASPKAGWSGRALTDFGPSPRSTQNLCPGAADPDQVVEMVYAVLNVLGESNRSSEILHSFTNPLDYGLAVPTVELLTWAEDQTGWREIATRTVQPECGDYQFIATRPLPEMPEVQAAPEWLVKRMADLRKMPSPTLEVVATHFQASAALRKKLTSKGPASSNGQ